MVQEAQATKLWLEWIDGGVTNSASIQPNQPSKNSGTVRIGRDPMQCDIVISDRTVSALQVEIFCHNKNFFVRPLRSSNLPVVNGITLKTGEALLTDKGNLTLGNITIKTHITKSPKEYELQDSNSFMRLPRKISLIENLAKIPLKLWFVFFVFCFVFMALFQVIRGDITFGGITLEEDRLGVDFHKKQNPDNPKIESESSDTPVVAPDSQSLKSFTHSSNLFRISIPHNWERIDTSKSGEVIIRWIDHKTESGVVVDLFKSHRLSQQELGELSRRFITNVFGGQPDLNVGQPTALNSGVVELGWEFSTHNDQVLGATYTEQSGDTVSVVSILVLRSDFDQVRPTFREILQSYRFDPSVPIP